MFRKRGKWSLGRSAGLAVLLACLVACQKTEAPVVLSPVETPSVELPRVDLLQQMQQVQNGGNKQFVPLVPIKNVETVKESDGWQPFATADSACLAACRMVFAEPREIVPTEPVDYFQHAAYMRGQEGWFRPDDRFSRAEAAQVLANLFPGEPVEISYTDVLEDSWFASGVAVAAEYLPGSNGSFDPGRTVTPAELVGALCRAQGIALTEEGRNLSDWEQDRTALTLAMEQGWITEEDAALEDLTRAQAASILNRALGRTPDVQQIGGLTTPAFFDVSPDHPHYADILEAALGHEFVMAEEGESWNPENIQDAKLAAGIHALNGMGYYVHEDGTILRGAGLTEADGQTYLIFGEDGMLYADEALHVVDGKVLFISADGTVLKNGDWGQFSFDENGWYTTGDEDLEAHIAAALAACTTEDMSRDEQLRACYEYVRGMKYLGRNAALPSSVKIMPMENAIGYANKIFETGKGDCYNFAAAFCFLARALGYEAHAIIGTCGYVWNTVPIAHGWVEIVMDGETYLFDPQIENYNLRAGISNAYRSAYWVTYQTAPGRYYKN